MIYNGDCLEVLKSMPDASVDSLVTDPPAGISFMGKDWDSDKGGRDAWIKWLSEVMRECLRVMKPGAHGLVWAIPRTSHWTATALENAGFEVRDTILHCFGQGFPKSLDIYKSAIKSGMACACEEFETTPNLPSLQGAIHAEVKPSFKQSEEMLPEVLRGMALPEPGDSRSFSGDFSKGNRSGKRAGRKGKESAPRSEEPGMEGRRDLQAEQGQLHRTKVRSVSQRVPADGPKGRLCDGAPSSYGDASRAVTPTSRGRASQGSRYPEQLDIESGAVSEQRGAQTCGSCGKTRVSKGLGTALKPAVEIWWLIRKPLGEKTVAKNVLKHGTGGLNIDGCRIEGSVPSTIQGQSSRQGECYGKDQRQQKVFTPAPGGRFPANLVLSHNPECVESDHGVTCEPGCAVAVLDGQSGVLTSGKRNAGVRKGLGFHGAHGDGGPAIKESSGGASRFFYCAKASKSDKGADNVHPTVKSTKLMGYLIRLVTPKGGTVLDCFAGSGSTGVAAVLEGFKFVGIEREREYAEIASKRMEAVV